MDGGRGGRGRGTDRGRGGRGRGASVAHTNGSRKENAEVSTPTPDSTAWDTPAATGDSTAWETAKATDDSLDTSKPAQETWSTSATSAAQAPVQVTSTIIPDGVKKSWASIFAPPPAPKKAPEPVVPNFRIRPD